MDGSILAAMRAARAAGRSLGGGAEVGRDAAVGPPGVAVSRADTPKARSAAAREAADAAAERAVSAQRDAVAASVRAALVSRVFARAGATSATAAAQGLPACEGCAGGTAPPFAFSMAFQPIVDVAAGGGAGRVHAYEALVRGSGGEGAPTVLARVTDANRYAFDQACRVRAIELATRLGLGRAGPGEGPRLSINFIPGAMYNPETCVRATLAAARRHAFPLDRVQFEVTEGEEVGDPDHLDAIFATYRRHGFTVALDDFGAGYSGLGLLARFQPDVLKLDMGLVRGLDGDRVRRSIVGAVLAVCRDLGITPVAEGVETRAEMDTLRSLGVSLMQGYLFAAPAFEALPEVAAPAGTA